MCCDHHPPLDLITIQSSHLPFPIFSCLYQSSILLTNTRFQHPTDGQQHPHQPARTLSTSTTLIRNSSSDADGPCMRKVCWQLVVGTPGSMYSTYEYMNRVYKGCCCTGMGKDLSLYNSVYTGRLMYRIRPLPVIVPPHYLIIKHQL